MHMNNLTVIHSANPDEIARRVEKIAPSGIHLNNGVYSAPSALIVPTMLSGYQYIQDAHAARRDAFMIAVNSDESVKLLMDMKNASAEERARQEPQLVRALKVAEPISRQFPKRPIIIAFYDQATPRELYATLDDGIVPIKTLHKWGFGTNPDAPRIEGAIHAEKVIGFPLPNDIKPVAYDITKRGNNANVEVVKLTETFGRHGAPYLSPDNKVLFRVADGLGCHAAASSVTAPRPAAPGL